MSKTFDPSRFEEARRKAGIRKNIEKMPSGMKESLLNILASEGDRSYFFKTCLDCISFTEQTEVCSKFGVRPPAKVIANGCDHYEDKDIPF